MIPGLFSFLLYMFSSPQTVLTNKLEGTWQVVEDNSESYRKYWHKIYTFEECDNPDDMKCPGYFGFADEPGVYTNLLDRSYFRFGVSRKKDDSGSRMLRIDDAAYYFELRPGKTLNLYDQDQNLLLRMEHRVNE